MGELCAEREAMLWRSRRNRDGEERIVSFERLKSSENGREARVSALATYSDDKMRFSDLFYCLCETFVPRMQRCCAVRSSTEMKNGE